MKILVLTPRYFPESFSITYICQELVNLGNSVTVLTGRPHYGKGELYEGYENIFNETIKGVNVIRVKEHIRKAGMLSLIKNYISIYKLYNKKLRSLNSDFDIVLSHGLSPIWTHRGVGRYCKKHNIPHIHYGLDLWPESFIATSFLKRNNLIYKAIKKMSIKIYNSCDLITFASPSVETYFHDYLKIRVPFKQIYQPSLTKVPQIEEISNHKYLMDGTIRILYCGTIARFHHLHLMIEALGKIPQNTNFQFDIVGSGSEIERVREEVSKWGLESKVVFYGRVSVEETKQFYENADVLYVPLYYNSFTSNMIPQKVIEYFMYGKPILGMLKGDGADLIREASELNVLVDQEPGDISRGILKLIGFSEDQLFECGRQNREYFDKNNRFTLQVVCEELEEEMIKLIRDKKNE